MDLLNQDAAEALMRQQDEALAAVAPAAAARRPRTHGVDPLRREFFQMISHMERGSLAGQPTAPPPLAVQDCLGTIPYHALAMAFLTKRAHHAEPHAGGADDEAARKDRLQRTLERHTRPLPLLNYTIRGICDAVLSPATLVAHRRTLYVACRGTQTFAELLADVYVRLQAINTTDELDGDGRAHTGILRAFAAQAAAVLERIDALEILPEGVTEVVFCGHSLGGGVAQLLALAYAQRRRQQRREDPSGTPPYRAQVVSFGSPHLGDEPMRLLLREYTDHQRLYVPKDPIAGVPSASTLDAGLIPDVRAYAQHNSACCWSVDLDRQATAGTPDQPVVRVFAVELPVYGHRHALTFYASALMDHRDQREGTVFEARRAAAAAAAAARPWAAPGLAHGVM